MRAVLVLLLSAISTLLAQQADSKLVLTQPPRASARMRLPEFFPDAMKLGDVASKVSAALTEAGYPDQGWFVVPSPTSFAPPGKPPAVGGFAVVTKLEEIDDRGRSKSGGKSWTLDASHPNAISFLDAARRLLAGAPVGRYRVFLIWVSNDPASQARTDKSALEDWENFLATGTKGPLLRVMDQVQVNYGTGGGCSVFVYEYDRSAITGEAQFVRSDDRLNAEQHLKASGIWGRLMEKDAQKP